MRYNLIINFSNRVIDFLRGYMNRVCYRMFCGMVMSLFISNYASLPETRDLIYMKNLVERISIKRNIMVSQYVRNVVSVGLELGVLSVGWLYLPSSQYYLLGLAAPKVCEIALQIQEERDNCDDIIAEFNEIQSIWKTFNQARFAKGKGKKFSLVLQKSLNEWCFRYDDHQAWIERNKKFLNLKFCYNV